MNNFPGLFILVKYKIFTQTRTNMIIVGLQHFNNKQKVDKVVKTKDLQTAYLILSSYVENDLIHINKQVVFDGWIDDHP